MERSIKPKTTRKLTYFQLKVAINVITTSFSVNSYSQLTRLINLEFNLNVSEADVIDYFEPDYKQLTEDKRLQTKNLGIAYK